MHLKGRFQEDVMKIIKMSHIGRSYCILSIAYIVIAAFSLGASYLIGQVVQTIMGSSAIPFYFLSLFFLCSVMTACLIYAVSMYCCQIREQLVVDFRIKTLRSIVDSELVNMGQDRKGDLLGRMQDNIVSAVRLATETIPVLMKGIIMVLGIFFVLLWQNPLLALLFLLTIPFLFFFQQWSQKKCEPSMDGVRDAQNDRNALFQDIIANESTVRNYQGYDTIHKWIRQATSRYVKTSVKAMLAMPFYFTPAILFVRVPVLLVCGVASAMTLKGHMEMNRFLMVLLITMYGTNEINNCVQQLTFVPVLASFARQLYVIWDKPHDPDGVKEEGSSQIPVSADALCFYYERETPCLEQIHFQVRPHILTAITGPSGCGKSTFLSLVAGFYQPTAGTIRVYGTEVQEWKREALYRRMGYLAQDEYLFPMSIMENIVYGGGTEEAIEKAVRIVGVEELIQKEIAGDANANKTLSGGERQKVVLARALSRCPELLLIDEGLSAVDQQMKNTIIRNMRKGYPNMTVIMVSHDFELLMEADQVIVLKDCGIYESGTPMELMSLKGWFFHAAGV